MHAIVAFFASIIAVVSSVFASPTVAPNALIDSQAKHTAAAAATQIASSNPFFDPSASPVTPADPTPAFSSPPPQTVINQPVVERIIERVVPQGNAGISADKLTAILTDFGKSIEARLAAINPPKADIPQQIAAAGNAGVSGFFPASQRIDQLSNTAINAPTITGGAISGASSVGASSGAFDALSAGTLALSGALTGTDATFSGTLTAGTLNVAGLSSQGALIGPYFTATSTTATSTFAGGLTAANGGFSILQNGNVGIGTQSPTAKLAIEASGTNGIDIRRAGSVFGTGIRTFASRGTTASPTQSQTNDTLGNFEFWGLDDTGVYRRPAYIAAKASENLTSASSAGYLSFFIAPTGSVNATERLRIDASGNVGIGTTTPGALLSAAGNILGAGTLALTGTTGTTTIAAGQGFTIGGSQFVVQQGSGNIGLGTVAPTGRLHILTGTSLVTPNVNADNLVIEQGSSDTGITIATQNNAKGIVYFGDPQNPASGRVIYDHSDDSLQFGANSAERLRIASSGNIGIGTTSPAQLFSVAGNGYLTGGLGVGLANATAGTILTSGSVTVGQGSTNALYVGGNPSLGNYNIAFTGGLSTPTIQAANGGTTNIPLAIQTAGTAALTLGNSTGGVVLNGNVGIGTTSPGALLSANGNILGAGTLALTGTTGTTTIAAGQGFTIGTSQFVLQQGSGFVGIGTAAPAASLHAAGNSIFGSLSSNSIVSLRNANDTTGSSSYNLENNSGTVFGRWRSYNASSPTTLAGISMAGAASLYAEGLLMLYANGDPIYFATNNTSPTVTIATSGNVGIGTTTPGSPLTVGTSNGQIAQLDSTHASGGYLAITSNGTGAGVLGAATQVGSGSGLAITDFGVRANNNLLFVSNGASTHRYMVMTTAGNVGIGTTTPGGKLDVVVGSNDKITFTNDNGVSTIKSLGTDSTYNYLHLDGFEQRFLISGAEKMRIDSTGNVGVGTTTPTAQLSTTGTVRFAGLGSGGANLVTDALGNVTASSDERLKDKQGDFTRGLAAINAIAPVLYKWRPETGFDTQSTYAGFFAQNVQAAIPEAVSQDARGHLTLADRPILAALVNAAKELAQRFSDLAERITTKELVAVNGDLRRVAAEEICAKDSAGETCITRSQLVALLAAAGQTAGSPSTNVPTTDASQPPVLELNGNASSTIEMGDIYSDLGARIVAPETDLNLGLLILLDGATTTQVSLDTSAPGEHTIVYTVTSPTTGLTGSIMRTVIVSPTVQLPSPVVEDNPFTSQPANDNVSTTSLLFAEPVAFSL
jgi:hypothetical protein